MFQPSNVGRLSIGTLNVRRLASSERLLELQEELEGINIDVIALTELRWRGTGSLQLSDSGFCFYHAGPESSEDVSGTGFLVSSRMKPFVEAFRPVSPRISALDLKFGRQLLRLFAVYAPPTSATRDDEEDEEDEYDSLLETLRSELRAASMSGQRGASSTLRDAIAPRLRVYPALLGDFNAKIGRKEEDDEEAVGNFGYGDRNVRGQQLLDFCEENHLRAVNTFFKARPGRKWTWISPNGHTKNCIDFVLASRLIRFQSATVLGSCISSSDHRLVRAVIQTPKREVMRHEDRTLKKKYRLNRDLFRMALTTMTPCANQQDSPEDYANLVAQVQSAAEFAREPEEKSPRLSEETKRLFAQRRHLKYRRSTAAERIALTELNKLIRREIRKDLVKHHQRLVEEAIRRNRGLRHVRREAAIGRRRLTRLRDADGNLCSTTTQLKRTVKAFYEALYSSTVDVQYEEHEAQEECPDLLISEVGEALKTMRNGTAPGIDKITVEMLKTGSHVLLPWLTKLFNMCLRTCSIPQKMADSSTILLHKKGDPLELKNYRPISLLSAIYKLLTKVLTKRIERILDAAQPVEQAGFRKNFSTIDHLQAINQLVERSREYRLPLFIVFVDYEKAFDTVELNAVWSAVQQQGVPGQITKLLQKIYQEATSPVNINDEPVPIEIRRGVRQGDTISPKLFTATLEHVFRHLQWEEVGININGSRLSNLRFADDIALIAETAEDLQKMMDELNEASQRAGLKINANKTKLMSTEPTSILLNGSEVERVESFVYLGQEVRLVRDHGKEMSRRICSGWNVFKQYKQFLTNPTVEMRWKRRLFNMCVLPAMLYGAETWALTKSACKRLATAQRKMERRMVGVRLVDKKTNDWLRGVTKISDVAESAKKRKMKYAWKLANEDEEKWSKRLTDWRPIVSRPLGRPRTRWRDDIRKALRTQAWQNQARRTTLRQWLNIMGSA
ncbi:hypothetical protein QR680_008579 [Steinernema hermaphroditum]|uniref:Reverse transcriptase domain-containing protein n=1 Tax=Steinernema hermaphroditum TaxID=289476 RepID=A0AA39IIL7_9BILA|nr:hypothetical protein QR680_008579 [Steinernema hermaphroditum]